MIWVDVGMVGRMSLSRVVVKGRGSFMVGDGDGWKMCIDRLGRIFYFVVEKLLFCYFL